MKNHPTHRISKILFRPLASLKFHLSILTILSILSINAQNNFNAEDELFKSIQIPNSPEAQAFTKYGDMGANLYTGSPSIGIPLHTISGRELNIPLSLTYDASGIKVEQEATQSGLGWNLAVGGRISRISNGFPDGYLSSSPSEYETIHNSPSLRAQMLQYEQERVNFPSIDALLEYREFLRQISKNAYDTQLDYYSLNAIGINDYIVFDVHTMEPKILNNPRIKVEVLYNSSGHEIASWKVTNDDGAIYHFEQAEITRSEGDDYNVSSPHGIVKTYHSSWVLTRVISPNSKDYYQFEYESYGFWQQSYTLSAGEYSNEIIYNGNQNDGFMDTPSTVPAVADGNFQPTVYINQQFLKSIIHNTREVISVDYKNREDFNDKALDVINIKTWEDENTIFKKIVFDHSYFGDWTNIHPAQHKLHKRLKLDGVRLLNANDTLYQDYSFEYYHPEDVPSKISKGQDYLGYYNGKGNSVLFPRVEFSNGNLVFEGANRDVDFTYAINGTLKRITYPTGGHTEFNYGSHTSPVNQEDIRNQDMHWEYYGGTVVSSGTNPNTVCGACCQDAYINPPNVSHQVFNVAEAGYYNVNYQINNNQYGGGPSEAYLFKRTAGQCDPANTPPYTYEQIINQADCTVTNTVRNLVWQYLNNSQAQNLNDQVYLEPGCYQVTLIRGDYSAGSNSISVRRWEPIEDLILGEGEMIRAGLRIASITDYTSENEIALKKDYQYTTGRTSSTSSGNIVGQVKLYDIVSPALLLSTDHNSYGCEISEHASLIRNSQANFGNQPHVAYEKVYEQKTNPTDNSDNGYVEKQFNVGVSGLHPYGIFGGVNFYNPSYEVGKESTVKAYTTTNDLVSKSEQTYDSQTYHSGAGMYTRTDNSRRYHAIVMFQNSDGTYSYSFTPMTRLYYQFGEFANDAISPAGCYWSLPPICDDPNYTCYQGDLVAINDNPSNHLDLNMTLAYGKAGFTTQTKETQYFDNDSTQVRTTYEHDAAINYLLRNVETAGSKAHESRTKVFYYPQDLNQTSTAYQAMVNNNMVSLPVKEENYLNNSETGDTKKVFTKTTEFQEVYNHIMPLNIKVAKNNDAMETRLTYHKISPHGNPEEVSQADGTHSIYVWGYRNSYPILKIDNATYEGMPNDAKNLISQISGASNSEDTEADEANLRMLYNQLRAHSYFEFSQITAYTYDPLVGVTSITDPRGETVYYTYDAFNRLEVVKDQQGRIISSNDYNYRTQN